nr:hypothetical protein CFP56_63985 [Quercus suber]
MDTSWFSKASSARRALLSDSHHELPRWRDPSPMTASIIPAPIVQSTYTATPKAPSTSSVIRKPAPLDDRQRDIEADLQFLLDAQADELERGRHGGVSDEQTSTGSSTPTAQSTGSASHRHPSRPVRSKLGLKGARKGIYHSIVALSLVKDEELQVIDAEVHAKDAALAQIDGWEQKRQGLQDARNTIDEHEDTARVQRLKHEAEDLQQEINQVEMQLSDLKARQRKLLRKAASVENAVQAKLATYTSSLSLLDADVQKFLSSTPSDAISHPRSVDGEASVWQLPLKTRTLDMARAHYMGEREAVLAERKTIAREHAALREGAAMWKEVVIQIGAFEKQMRAAMNEMASPPPPNAWDESPPQQHPDPSANLRQLLVQLHAVLASIETKFRAAEEHDWRLLIAAIGAELDAFRQGERILQGLLGVHSSSPDEESDLVDAPSKDEVEEEEEEEDGGREIHELDKSFETTRPTLKRADSSGTEDTDNDPDPELLFSKGDIDR